MQTYKKLNSIGQYILPMTHTEVGNRIYPGQVWNSVLEKGKKDRWAHNTPRKHDRKGTEVNIKWDTCFYWPKQKKEQEELSVRPQPEQPCAVLDSTPQGSCNRPAEDALVSTEDVNSGCGGGSFWIDKRDNLFIKGRVYWTERTRVSWWHW